MKHSTQSVARTVIVTAALWLGLPSGPVLAELTAVEKAEIVEQTLTRLNGTEWVIQLSGIKNEELKLEDTLQFTDGKMGSVRLGEEGYSQSNISVNVKDENNVTWETMQRAEGKGPVFWRGNLSENGVRGVISKQLDDGTSEGYYFKGSATGSFEQKSPKLPVVEAKEVKVEKTSNES